MRVKRFEFRVLDLGFWIWGLRFRFWDLEFRIEELGVVIYTFMMMRDAPKGALSMGYSNHEIPRVCGRAVIVAESASANPA